MEVRVVFGLFGLIVLCWCCIVLLLCCCVGLVCVWFCVGPVYVGLFCVGLFCVGLVCIGMMRCVGHAWLVTDANVVVVLIQRRLFVLCWNLQQTNRVSNGVGCDWCRDVCMLVQIGCDRFGG